MSHCRGCGREILWAKTVRGRPMPLDPEPDPLRGRIALHHDQATVLRGHDLATAQLQGDELYVPHWATCANAKDFRLKGKSA